MEKERRRKILKIILQAASYLLFMMTILSAYGGYMDPQRWTLPAIALLVFPYFAVATILVSAIWFLKRCYIVGSIGVAVLLACGPTFLDAVPFRFHGSASKGETTFKMITFNCLHLKDLRQPHSSKNRAIDYLINSGADFICLQELPSFKKKSAPHATQRELNKLLETYPYYTTDKKDVKFLSKYPFKVVPYKLEKAGNYQSIIIVEVDINGHKLTVVNVHLPSFALTEKQRNIITDVATHRNTKQSLMEMAWPLYRKMKTAFQRRAKVAQALAELTNTLPQPIILCGDFNDVPGSWSYRFFTKEGFNDAYAQTGFGPMITYNKHLMYFHIDQILYKGDLIPIYVKRSSMNSSDHYPLEAEFAIL